MKTNQIKKNQHWSRYKILCDIFGVEIAQKFTYFKWHENNKDKIAVDINNIGFIENNNKLVETK